MSNLKMDATRYTLGIDFDEKTGQLEMKGDSYPENPFEFFETIFNWIETYLSKSPARVAVILKFNYLNTSSTKCILDILELLDKYYAQGGKIEVQWFCEEDDDDILELGEEFMEDFAMPVEIISYQREV